MTASGPITVERSGAFVETFALDPTGSGPLDGLTFAVKDLIDVAGKRTGCGNPDWRDGHPDAAVHAVCVEQLLAAGARCVGKTVTDELAFSLLGENHFYGTPLNPKAPDRVPGGSSSGSASAVACGLADVALGTDTGGSVRVPAGNCGIWGLRPSHGFVSVAGVNPFAPGFDTVGVFGRTADVVARAASVLLACDVPRNPEPRTVFLVREALALADADVRDALAGPLAALRDRYGERVREVSLADVVGDPAAADFGTWFEAYSVLQWAEIESCLGAWIDDRKPTFGPFITGSFALARSLDRRRILAMVDRRERYYRGLKAFLRSDDLLCLPTAPTTAPLKGNTIQRDQGSGGYYPRALGLTSVAGIGRLPQVSMPLADVGGVPVGLSLLAARGADGFLLGVAEAIGGE